ncbi:MAG TPA: hypothetical protein VGC78_10470 [Gaiellaceae bacterium]
MNRRSKKAVLAAIAAVCLVVFAAGMAAAWNNRHHTICADGKPPLRQRGGLLGQVVYECQDGRLVTTPG